MHVGMDAVGLFTMGACGHWVQVGVVMVCRCQRHETLVLVGLRLAALHWSVVGARASLLSR